MNMINTDKIQFDEILLADTSDHSWFGQTYKHYRGHINEIRKMIPYFERKGFVINESENKYLDLILRIPLNSIEKTIPINTVSKQYNLIQHHELIDFLQEGINNCGLSVAWDASDIILSEYGERMHLSIVIPNFDFNPGDNYPVILKINCLNSVDKSTSLEIKLSWFRLICSNGMSFGTGIQSFKKAHLTTLSSKKIEEFLNIQMNRRSIEESKYREWYNTNVSEDNLIHWVDDTLTKKWGPHLAARAYSIMSTGCDAKVIERQNQSTLAHELEIINLEVVPGSCSPVKNAFHASQSLSWLAGHRNTVQDQLEKVMQIPDLIESLLNMK
jgi:hypothetical protein